MPLGLFILILVVLGAGIGFGFQLGVSRTLREAACGIRGTYRPVIARLVIGLGCAALVGALAAWVHIWQFTRIAQRAIGTVLELRQVTDKETGSVSYAPTFRFQDAAGVQHTVSSSFYSSPPEFRVGDSVTVLYRSDDPQTARIDSYWQVWGLATLLGIVGSLAMLVGTIVLIWSKITARFRGPSPEARAV